MTSIDIKNIVTLLMNLIIVFFIFRNNKKEPIDLLKYADVSEKEGLHKI